MQTQTAERRDTLIGALQNLSQDIGAPLKLITGAFDDFLKMRAASDYREDVIVRYTVGTGEWDDRKKYNVLRMKMFKTNGEPDGTHDGVWEPVQPPSELPVVPPKPRPPLDQPKGPVPETLPRAYTKAIWTFGDGSSITAVGPAMLHLVPFSDGSQIFLVSVAAIITNGTGRFAGARGVKTALGSTFVPAGMNIVEVPKGQRFGAVTVETFRVVKAEYIGTQP
jgi:hypothetical protein